MSNDFTVPCSQRAGVASVGREPSHCLRRGRSALGCIGWSFDVPFIYPFSTKKATRSGLSETCHKCSEDAWVFLWPCRPLTGSEFTNVLVFLTFLEVCKCTTFVTERDKQVSKSNQVYAVELIKLC